MAATEIIVGSLQQSSSSVMGSPAILSIKPLHPSYEFGRPYKKHIPSLQSIASKEDRGRTLRKPHEESSSRSSGVSSLLKAVQEGGSSVVLQQVSSIRHFFMPELPQAIITEIKKRIALSFKDEDDEESAIQDDLNGGLLEKGLEDQVTLLGPRCAWPRLKLVSAEEERREEATQGPRCTWPRGASATSSVQQWKQEERPSSTIGEGGNGAKCTWPRATSRNNNQSNTERFQEGGIVSSRSSLEGFKKVGISKSQQEGIVTSMKSTQDGLEKEAVSKRVEEEKEEAIIEGPRCAWPRSTPRRMIATGVGLSLMNYLFIGQDAHALAILVETHPCAEEPSLISTPHKSLLP